MSQPAAQPPATGDEQVDRILADFAARGDEDLAGRLEAASEAHRHLQRRLTHPEADAPPGG